MNTPNEGRLAGDAVAESVRPLERPQVRRRALAVALPEAPNREFWIALVSTALLLRALVALGLLGNMPLFSDAAAYSNQGADLVHGVNQDFPYYFPAGTSYVLAAGYWLFGIHLWVAHVLMIALSVLAVVTTAQLALRLLREVRPALLAGWVLALYPGMAMMAAQPFSFDVTLLCVNLTVLFALRGWESGHLRDYAVSGLALGAAAVTRPSTLSIAVPLAVAALIAVRRRRRQERPARLVPLAAGSVVGLACAVAVMAPAVAHNASVDQGLTLSVNNELNTWFGNNPYTPNYRTNYLGQHPFREFGPETEHYLRRFFYSHTHPTRAQRARVRDETVRFVEHHPAVTLLRTVNRARAFWGFDYTISNLFRTDWGKGYAGEAVGLVFEAGGYFVLALLVITGLIFARDLLQPGALWLLLGLIAAFELPYTLVYSGGRWHYPLLGLLAIFAGMGANWLIDTPDRWQRLRTSKAFWIATGAFVIIQIEYAYYLVYLG